MEATKLQEPQEIFLPPIENSAHMDHRLAQLEELDRKAEFYLNHQKNTVEMTNKQIEEINKQRQQIIATVKTFFSTLGIKSIKVTNGEIKSKTEKGAVEIQDEDKLLQWLRDNEYLEFIETPMPPPPRVKKVDFKKWVKKNIKGLLKGEIPDGCDILKDKTSVKVMTRIELPDKFYISDDSDETSISAG